MKVVVTDGTRKMVSSVGARCRFMSAIWNSYSKSATARRPRTESVAPTSRAKSTSSPWKCRTSTRGAAPVATSPRASRTIAARSSSVNAGCLVEFTATPTTSRSTNSRLRCIRSRCPSVTGSKLPA